MADNTLFWPIIDFIGRHLSRARTGDDGGPLFLLLLLPIQVFLHVLSVCVWCHYCCCLLASCTGDDGELYIYGYQEIVLVVYVLSNDILLKPIRPQVERIGWPIIDGGR